MPIKIPNDLPATETLHEENTFVITETRALTQDIRPLKILLLNLMPTKIVTETQFSRLLGNTPLQVELEFLQTATHKSTHTDSQHLINFYQTFDEIKHKKYMESNEGVNAGGIYMDAGVGSFCLHVINRVLRRCCSCS